MDPYMAAFGAFMNAGQELASDGFDYGGQYSYGQAVQAGTQRGKNIGSGIGAGVGLLLTPFVGPAAIGAGSAAGGFIGGQIGGKRAGAQAEHVLGNRQAKARNFRSMNAEIARNQSQRQAQEQTEAYLDSKRRMNLPM